MSPDWTGGRAPGAIVADVVHQDVDPPMFGEHSPASRVTSSSTVTSTMWLRMRPPARSPRRGSDPRAADRSRRLQRVLRVGRTGGRSGADAVASPLVTTATRPSSSRFQSSMRDIVREPDSFSPVVTRHSDGPYAGCERIASSMTDSEGSSATPDDATSCDSPCSRRSCSGCSISLQSPASSMSRMCGARLPPRGLLRH